MLFSKSKPSMGYSVWCGWAALGVAYFLSSFRDADCENDAGEDGPTSIPAGAASKNTGSGTYGTALGWEVGSLVFLVGWLGIML